MIALVAAAWAGTVPIDGTDIVIEEGIGDRFVPLSEAASVLGDAGAEALDSDAIGLYVPMGASPADAVQVSRLALKGVDPSLPLEPEPLMKELRSRDESIVEWLDPPVWDPTQGLLSWAIRGKEGLAVGWVARPGKNEVVVGRRVSDQDAWPSAKTDLAGIAPQLGFAPGAKQPEGSGRPLGDVVLAAVAPAPVGGGFPLGRLAKLAVFLVVIVVGPMAINAWRTSRGQAPIDERPPDLDD